MVTKGFLNPGKEKDADEEKPVEEPEVPAEIPADTPAEVPVDAPVVEEKQLTTKSIDPIISTLKGVLVALEDLVQKDQEPEGNELPAEETDEEKALKEFSQKRKILQDASTVLAEVLAEARQAIEAQKA